jgi:hypothetical protein
MFRAASGLGGLLAPLLGAGVYAWGGYLAVFMYVGVGYIAISPFVYKQLYKARDAFNALAIRESHASLDLEEREGLLNEEGGIETQPQKPYAEIKATDMMKSAEFTFAMLTMIMWTAAFLYQSTILNPMLLEIYDLEP